jgi:hypothetical protein
MTDLEAALVELAGALEACTLPYVVIGGLAVSLSGEPRATLDVDVSVWAAPERLPGAIDCLCARFRALRSNPHEFVERHRVLPIATASGIRADVVFAAIPAEQEIIRRAVRKRIGDRMIPVASVEDLLFMKLLSTREKYKADAAALFRRHGKSLDRAYLVPKLREAAESLDRPEILDWFRDTASSG